MKLLWIGFLSMIISAQSITSVYFETNSSSLDAVAKKKLDSLSPTQNMTIQGFADHRNSNDYNIKLSKQRALAVFHYIRKKFPKTAFRVSAMGEVEGNLEQNRRVDIFDTASFTLEPTVPLHQLKVGESASYSNILFYGGKSTIREISYPVLEKVVTELKKNPTIEIEIRGHICCREVGDEDRDGEDLETGEKNLSLVRAKKVYHYLIENGIDAKRLSYSGHAAKFIDRTKSNNQNRRVEIKVIKK